VGDFPNKYPRTSTEKAEEMAGKNFSSAAEALAFFVWLFWSPPPALEVTGDLD
jgi:hypothetical protein